MAGWSSRWGSVVAFGFASGGTGVGVALGIVSTGPPDPGLGPVLSLVLPVGLLSFPVVGVLVARRRPGNPIGWLLLAMGVLFGIGIAADSWLRFEPGPPPGAVYGAWVAHWTIQSPAMFTIITFILLLFPEGPPPWRPWRHLARAAAGVGVLYVILAAFKPGPLAETDPPVPNPVALDVLGPIWEVLELPLFLGIMLGVPAAALVFVGRFRRSRGTERQQLKWVAAAGVLAGVIVGIAPVVFAVEALWWVWPILFLAGMTSLPVAAGIAIMRYRLYEIDRIVSRTVTYAVVTAVLVGLYAGITVGVGGLLGGGSDVLVAGATLSAAALFRPLRGRIQSIVDRRFNRSRYDAERTVDAFSARLRDEVDLDALRTELRSVVLRTVAPAHVRLWTPGELP